MKYRGTVVDGRQLKAGRVLAGLTIREMAALVRLNRNTVLRVEKFHTLPLFTHAGDRIAEVLMSLGIEFVVQDGRPGVFFSGATQRLRRKYLK